MTNKYHCKDNNMPFPLVHKMVIFNKLNTLFNQTHESGGCDNAVKLSNEVCLMIVWKRF